MTRHLLLLAAALLLTACAGAGVNGAASPPELWRLPDYDHQAACTPERAVRVKISDITTNIARYHRTCVTVEGILFAGRLFETRDDLYRVSTRTFRGNRSAADIEIRARSELNELPGFHVARVTGIVTDCDLEHAEWQILFGLEYAVKTAATGIPGDIWVTTDHSCWPQARGRIYTSHITLDLVTVFERLVETTRKPDLGNLIELAPESKMRALAAQISDDFLAAIKDRDRDELARQLAGGPRWRENEDALRVVEEILGIQVPPGAISGHYSSVMQVADREESQRVILGEIPPVDPADFWRELIETYAVVCFCAEDECAGRWPIDTIDTGFSSERPYVCLHILDEDMNGEADISVFLDEEGLAEPQVSPEP